MGCYRKNINLNTNLWRGVFYNLLCRLYQEEQNKLAKESYYKEILIAKYEKTFERLPDVNVWTYALMPLLR